MVAGCQREHVLDILVPRCSNLGLPHPQTAPEPASKGARAPTDGEQPPRLGDDEAEMLRETNERERLTEAVRTDVEPERTRNKTTARVRDTERDMETQGQ